MRKKNQQERMVEGGGGEGRRRKRRRRKRGEGAKVADSSVDKEGGVSLFKRISAV